MLRNIQHKASQVLAEASHWVPACHTMLFQEVSMCTLVTFLCAPQAIRDKFGVESDRLRFYVHYQP